MAPGMGSCVQVKHPMPAQKMPQREPQVSGD